MKYRVKKVFSKEDNCYIFIPQSKFLFIFWDNFYKSFYHKAPGIEIKHEPIQKMVTYLSLEEAYNYIKNIK